MLIATPIYGISEPFELFESPVHKQLAFTAVVAVVIGILLVIFAETMEKMRARSQQNEALEVRDRMIIPPRCDAKSRDMGLTQVQNWKDYFYRDEPFVPTP
ncbi:hypothetical protein Y032_0011g1301 [Ancylostoma ceylanicum]|uniref:Uncharacterized protein n=1 Tax=Ancylostoma ceylanicum TaxID=53326 RepID=A0A016VFV8_9BILA|nr:hypothetical protein Y032_0011g1301 [Ancylostoma ceylanicum]